MKSNPDVKIPKRDVNIRDHRIMLTKIRISNHMLAFEMGRFSKIPSNERLCGICKNVNRKVQGMSQTAANP